MYIILCGKGELSMSHPILVTGAAGGSQGSTGRIVATFLLQQGIPVRAFVHKLDARCDELRRLGAEIFEGDLLNPASVQRAMNNVKRAYFTYPVAEGMLEAATIFAATARDAGLEMVVNNSQSQGAPDDPAFRDLRYAASFRNLQHRPADSLCANHGRAVDAGSEGANQCSRCRSPDPSLAVLPEW